MFGIGTSELLIILLIALLVLGPREIPKIAKTLGRGMRELQRAKDELRQTLTTEVEEKEESVKPSNSPGNNTDEKEGEAASDNPSNTDKQNKKEI